MKNSPINISILQDQNSQAIAISVWHLRDSETFAYIPVAVDHGEARWGWASVEGDGSPPPSFLIPFSLVKRGLIQDLVNEIAQDLGIVAERAKEADSLLAVKDAHLNDLRNILFGSDWIEVQRGKPQLVKED